MLKLCVSRKLDRPNRTALLRPHAEFSDSYSYEVLSSLAASSYGNSKALTNNNSAKSPETCKFDGKNCGWVTARRHKHSTGSGPATAIELPSGTWDNVQTYTDVLRVGM